MAQVVRVPVQADMVATRNRTEAAYQGKTSVRIDRDGVRIDAINRPS